MRQFLPPLTQWASLARILWNSMLFVNYFAFYSHISAFRAFPRVLSITDGPCSKKRTSQNAYTLICIGADSGYHAAYRGEQDRSGLVLKAPPSRITARVSLASVAPSLWCLKRQSRMRSRCTNSTQGIQYPHAGIYLLSA